MENKIELKSIKELFGMRFFIPNYQRGYRWTKEQVADLLDDLNAFTPDSNNDGFYCLQPLVVKKRETDTLKSIKDAKSLEEVEMLLKGEWEVIDGQQRLTTIFILLSYLNCKEPYSLQYETRQGSEGFLKDIEAAKKDKNIDYYHIFQAHETIKDWFQRNPTIDSKIFREKLLDRVKFIWYESVDENAIQVFTRLNIGKIRLTNAELIKALFLNRTNFKNCNSESLRLRQMEIASEWDKIEYTLQDEEFWLFLHRKGYDRPTRIDFIFDLICRQNALNLEKEIKNTIGSDDYRTFRYFYAYFESGEADVEECWKQVKTYYQIFQEWYADLELYHYIGYLIAFEAIHVEQLVSKWCELSEKSSFVSYLKEKIGEKISSIGLEHQYKEDGSDKRNCLPILLFHNIQTVINQNRTQRDNSKYQMGTFYKFPFHLYKLESWDVEHINSSTENPESAENTQKEWLLNVYLGADEDIQKDIRSYFGIGENEYDEGRLYEKIKKRILPNKEEWSQEERNRIWNYALLDSSTNRSYGNIIFSGKRRIIIGKDKGKYIAVPKLTKNGELELGNDEDASSSFVPPCTKQVFLKYYSPITTDNNYWTIEDARAYLNDIKECIKKLEE